MLTDDDNLCFISSHNKTIKHSEFKGRTNIIHCHICTAKTLTLHALIKIHALIKNFMLLIISSLHFYKSFIKI